MKYIQNTPCLEHIALVKIVATLWRQKDIRELIPNSFNLLYFLWQKIENRVIKNVSQLPVPGILKEKIKCFVKPIGLQIKKWILDHCTDDHIQMDLLGEFCWTPQGTIDGKETAQVLIKDENIHTKMRYQLACIYCLENDIVELWNRIPERYRGFFVLSSEFHSGFRQHLMQLYWSHIMQVGYNDPDFTDKSMFRMCAKKGNKTATKYFLQKLTSAEREEYLVNTAMCVEDSELLVFLLSQMNEEQEREVFKNNTYKVLLCLLDWPSQNFFVEIIDRMWEFLSRIDFDKLLKKIMEKIRDGYKDCSYDKLFEIFWQKSPSGLKSYVIVECSSRYLLPYLTEIKDKDKIKLIFQDAAFTVKKDCIYSYMMKIFSNNFVIDEEWDFLRFLLQEWLPLGTERIKIKEELEVNMANDMFKNRFKMHTWENFKRDKYKWDQLFLTSDFDRKYNKRELEESESRPFKTSHIIQ